MSNLSKSLALATMLSLGAILGGATEALAVYCAKIEVVRGPLNVRSGPGTAFRDVGDIPKDSIVRVEERNNVPLDDPNWNWLRISMYENLAGNAINSPGWISSDCVGPGFACQPPLSGASSQKTRSEPRIRSAPPMPRNTPSEPIPTIPQLER